jgi:hypothetical protein
MQLIFWGCLTISSAAIVVVVTTKKEFLAFRVPPGLKDDIQAIATNEARSISQICELLLVESVEAYRKEGPKFIQRLVAKHNARTK